MPPCGWLGKFEIATPTLKASWACFPSITPPLRGSRSRPRRLRWEVRIGTDSLTFPTSRFSRYVGEGFIPYPLPPLDPSTSSGTDLKRP